MAKNYKYYSGLTSQLPFCAMPLRLDAYSKCQFSCGYCFASTRQGYGRNEAFKISNPESLIKRLERVSSGYINSALDEFIAQRIPFQLGGMSDPFTKSEESKEITLDYLKILKHFNYPVVLSTKSDLIASSKYLELLAGANVYVRFSVTVVDESYRAMIDRGCPPLNMIAKAAHDLSSLGIPVSFRLQPIIPGYEVSFDNLLEVAKDSGVKHLSAEYLKVPIDANKKFSQTLKNLLGGDPIKFYRSLGAAKLGREYLLPLDYRAKHLIKMATLSREQDITFGFADNDLLIHSDGTSCCSAADLYLKDASFFDANLVGVSKNKLEGDKLYFGDLVNKWMPKKPVSTYLNSSARLKVDTSDIQEWPLYLQEMWKGAFGVYKPSYFDGIELTNEFDECGLPVYKRHKSDFEKQYEKMRR